MARITRKMFEEHLNEVGKSIIKEDFVFNGKLMTKFYPNRYGKGLKKYDPILFDRKFKQYVKRNSKNYTI